MNVGRVLFAAAAVLLPALAEAGPDDIAVAVERLAKSAESAGVARVSVLDFSAKGGAEVNEAEYIGELVGFHLSGRKKPALIERSQIEKVLRANRLSFQQGSLDDIFAVDAVVFGSVFGGGGKLKVLMKLAEVRTGRVLAAARAETEREWPEFPEIPAGDLSFETPTSFTALYADTAPAFRPPKDLRDAPAGTRPDRCSERRRRLAEQNTELVDEKARYWADRMSAPGFSIRDLTRNPGSEISDPHTKNKFYSLLNSYYREGGYLQPSGDKKRALAELLREENDYYNECPR